MAGEAPAITSAPMIRERDTRSKTACSTRARPIKEQYRSAAGQRRSTPFGASERVIDHDFVPDGDDDDASHHEYVGEERLPDEADGPTEALIASGNNWPALKR